MSKKIKVKVRNKELNALEDYLWVIQSKKKKRKSKKLCVDLLIKLIHEYDKN